MISCSLLVGKALLNMTSHKTVLQSIKLETLL